MGGKAYEDRACCEGGTNVPSDVCPGIRIAKEAGSSSNNVGLIVGVVVGVVILGAAAFYIHRRRNKANSQPQPVANRSASYEGLEVIPHPSAPANPAFVAAAH